MRTTCQTAACLATSSHWLLPQSAPTFDSLGHGLELFVLVIGGRRCVSLGPATGWDPGAGFGPDTSRQGTQDVQRQHAEDQWHAAVTDTVGLAQR